MRNLLRAGNLLKVRAVCVDGGVDIDKQELEET